MERFQKQRSLQFKLIELYKKKKKKAEEEKDIGQKIIEFAAGVADKTVMAMIAEEIKKNGGGKFNIKL